MGFYLVLEKVREKIGTLGSFDDKLKNPDEIIDPRF
jgi:hypothetical protein